MNRLLHHTFSPRYFFDFVNVTVSKPVSIFISRCRVIGWQRVQRDAQKCIGMEKGDSFPLLSATFTSTQFRPVKPKDIVDHVFFDHSIYIQCCILNRLVNLIQTLRKHCIGSQKSKNSQESPFKTLLKSRQKKSFHSRLM